MKKKDKYLKGFSMVEMLIVMGIFIILSVVGFNGFLSIRESFIARENVELIIQDIESTKLKAMNMEGGKDATWIYGFGIDFTQAHLLNQTGDYQFFKWCSPVTDYGSSFSFEGEVFYPTENALPNYFKSSSGYRNVVHDYLYECNTMEYVLDGTIPSCYEVECEPNRIQLVKTSEISTLLDREEDQIEVLNIPGESEFPAYIFFESLTGRAIIYDNEGVALGYEYIEAPINDVVFNRDEMIPLDIVLHRKRSNKFDLITVYPNSGEVIHHVYDNSEPSPAAGYCDSILRCIKVEGKMYQRYGIQEEINSFRD